MMNLGEKGKMPGNDLWNRSSPAFLLKTESAEALCSGLCWVGFWVSPGMATLLSEQPHWSKHFKCLTTFIVNKFYLMFWMSFISVFPVFLLLCSLLHIAQYLYRLIEFPLSILEAKQAQGPNLHTKSFSWSLAFEHWSEMRRKLHFGYWFTDELGPCEKKRKIKKSNIRLWCNYCFM